MEVLAVMKTVPFLRVRDIAASVHFYVDGLGFTMSKQWTPNGKLEWCWLEREGTALMLQEYHQEPECKVGVGVSICFQCDDALALYREFTAKGIAAKQPFVGNAMWVTLVSDPDGYKLDFESPTDVAEDTVYSE
jgi:lactoylglutathione lyase